MSEDLGRPASVDLPIRLGRDAAGLGVVVLLLLLFPAALFDWSTPIIANLLLIVPALVGLTLLIGGIGLQRGARWAVVVLSAAAPALIAASVGVLGYVLVLASGERLVGSERLSLVPWSIAAPIAFPGVLLWIVSSYAWDLRRGLQQLRRGANGEPSTGGRPRTSALAVASLVLSIPALAACFALYRPFPVLDVVTLALVLAVVAQVRIWRSRGRLRGTGFAVGAAAIYMVTVMMYPVFLRGVETAQREACLSHSVQLAKAMGSYLEDHRGIYPSAASWSDALKPYVSADTLRCPRAKNQRCSFAFNAALGGRTASDVTADPARLVLFFESDAGWNAHGGPELLPAEPRHFGGDSVSFVDGHAKWVPRARRGDLQPPRWLRVYPPDTVVWDPDAAAAEGNSPPAH